jgi:hypothetical protein
MSKRIDKSWLVFISIENFEHNRCVDLFSRPDGSYGFEEFRRDVEDRGEWTPVQYYSASVYTSKEATLAPAMQSVAWLADAIPQSPSAQKCCREIQTDLKDLHTSDRESAPSGTTAFHAVGLF